MPLPLVLCLYIKHSLKSEVLFSVLHMLYLEATTDRYPLKHVFFKYLSNQTHQIKIQTHRNDREDQHYHLNDVKLRHW